MYSCKDVFPDMDMSMYENVADCSGKYQCYWKNTKKGGTDKDINYHINLSFYLEKGVLKCKLENSLFHDTEIYDATVLESDAPDYLYMSKHKNSKNGQEYVYYSPEEAYFKGDTFDNIYYYKKAQ